MTPDNDFDIVQDDLMKQAETNAARKKYDDDSIHDEVLEEIEKKDQRAD